MSASFFDLLKYAKTGIASPDMTAYDKLKAKAIAGGGYPVTTITGLSPLSFLSSGKPLTAWGIKADMVQSGTPTPSAPIEPQEFGERTNNLHTFPFTDKINITGSGNNRTASYSVVGENRAAIVKLKPNTTYTISGDMAEASDHYCRIAVFSEYPVDGSVSTNYYYSSNNGYTTFTTGATEQWGIVYTSSGSEAATDFKRSLTESNTVLPYEPYGYKIPITNAGQTVPVYLGQTQTVRNICKLALTGDEGWGYTSGMHRIAISENLYKRELERIAISSHYEAVSNQPSASLQNNQLTFLVSSSGNNYMYIRDTRFDNANDFKAYLASEYAAGHPVTVWYVLAEPETAIVNEPLCKIGDYADELHSTDAGVTIPTVKGQNTLTVGTTLPPSEVSITGNIKAS